MNLLMRPLGLTNNGPRGAAQKPRGRRQAGEHRDGAAAPHLQPRECLHSRPLARQSRKDDASPSATLASHAVDTSPAVESPGLHRSPPPPKSQGAATPDTGRRSWQEKCQRIAPAQLSLHSGGHSLDSQATPPVYFRTYPTRQALDAPEILRMLQVHLLCLLPCLRAFRSINHIY
ncbi:hypothetical protein NDU88_000860 [Pleurodeles waltl]|uniref:Uncharacterized protein n=1 Tax=Pleurodeles waltl TaxID=8319 RepID=A0AAV7LBF2_PLEWA|nr:hypothetical protein NDU88_000860 [Pleurodeles waltl]